MQPRGGTSAARQDAGTERIGLRGPSTWRAELNRPGRKIGQTMTRQPARGVLGELPRGGRMFAQLQWHGTPQPMQAAGFCCRPKLNGDDGDWQDEQLDDKKDETATVRARAEEVGAPGKLSVVCFCCCCFCCCCCCEDGPLVVCRMRRGRGGDGGGRSEEGRQSADVMYASGFVWCGVNVSVFACVLARLDGEGEEASSAGFFVASRGL